MIVDTLRTVLMFGTSTPIVIAHTNGPAPARPYMAVRVVSEQQSPVIVGHIDDGGLQPVTTHATVPCEVQCFADDADDRLAALALAIRSTTMIDAANEAGITLDNIGQVRSMPLLRDDMRYDARAILEFDLRVIRSITDDVGYIERVIGTGNVADTSIPFDASIET